MLRHSRDGRGQPVPLCGNARLRIRTNRSHALNHTLALGVLVKAQHWRPDFWSIQVSRKAREKLSRIGFIMYSKNVRSPVLM